MIKVHHILNEQHRSKSICGACRAPFNHLLHPISYIAKRSYILYIIFYLLSLTGCRIEPPLKLPTEPPNVVVAMGEVITDLEVIWNLDSTWHDQWWYGWDDNDIRRWGKIEYPVPTNYEARFYYYGEEPGALRWESIDKLTIFASTVRRRFIFGYHNLLAWSNIDSSDGTQALIVDESDPGSVKATTSRSRLSFNMPPASRATEVYNNPEVFYSGILNDIYISKDPKDYDYYDPELDAWVKRFEAPLYPLVYLYLVQVAVYNNNGRILGLTDNAAISNMSDGVSLHTGHTNNHPVIVSYEMGFKHDLPARNGVHADIFGGKLTTFGLCDMQPWSKSRARDYDGSRTDLDNDLAISFRFSNQTDSAYSFRITPQLMRQAHGGIVTIEIDADTLKIPIVNPPGPTGPSSTFKPTVEETDTIEHKYEM